MSLLTTLAATVLMSPANVATDVPATHLESPAYDWQTQKVMSEKQTRFSSTTNYSTCGTMCNVAGMNMNDDAVPYD